MTGIIRYLTHPQVHMDREKDIPCWSLNDVGRARVAALALSGGLAGTRRVISSTETKAMETATPLAAALGCPLELRDRMHENDRSATGFLPPEEFERVADQFFAHPDASVRGWETARDAQARIVAEVQECLRTESAGDVLFVGHGAVGTLLYCALADKPISRAFDQKAGGGNFFSVMRASLEPVSLWSPMEVLEAGRTNARRSTGRVTA